MDSHNSPDLPPEVILNEILTRTSPETVARCRAVCKAWKEATYESRFDQFLNDRTKTVSGFFIQNMKKLNYSFKFVSMKDSNEGSKPSLSFLPNKRLRIEAAAKQGLLLCLNSSLKPRVPEYIICKPTTQQWWKLPNPKTRFFTLKTSVAVLGSHPLRYKIVRFSQPKSTSLRYTYLRCEIFDSRTWAWKSLPDDYINLPYRESLDKLTPPVSASGVLYCLTTERRFLAFDWERETWEVFDLPRPLCEGRVDCAVDREGRLGLIRMATDDCMELWVLEECSGEKTWSLKKKVNITTLLNKERYACPLALCCSDVALMKTYYDVVFCKFKGSSLEEIVKVRSVLSVDSDVEVFRMESDEELVDLKSFNVLRAGSSGKAADFDVRGRRSLGSCLAWKKSGYFALMFFLAIVFIYFFRV